VKQITMDQNRRVAFIGNSLPRKCGIATFTTDLQQATAARRPHLSTVIVAMNDAEHTYEYPAAVSAQIGANTPDDFLRAADFLNAGDFDAVSLQHEFGIFGGDAGSYILPLLARLHAPIVTTLHTVLAEPTISQRRVLEEIIGRSAKVVVMAAKGAQLLREVYATPPEKTEIIPHGVPDFPFVEPEEAKANLGFSNRTVILTFGLLSPNKGIEFMIDAMPGILRRCPQAVYVVLGATHPSLVRREGEIYRQSLLKRVQDLGIERHVVFFDQFVDKATLLGFIAMCDVYATPYLNEAQMTSGTLAYSFGLGKAIVSTPYWHAKELLANGLGCLVPFRNSGALSAAITELLTDDDRRRAIRKRGYAASRSMTWEKVADRYVALFDRVGRPSRQGGVRAPNRRPRVQQDLPNVQTEHLQAMCDGTGLFQHAIHSVPDRSHGYCVDDNARALLLASALSGPGESRLPEGLTARFAAFVQHAWNPDLRRFRNFMSYDRRWLEPCGSEDSHGRTLWALGACALLDVDPSRRLWAANLFGAAFAIVADFTSPRAWAFALLGLDGYCAARFADTAAQSLRRVLADRLVGLLAANTTDDWTWFESSLSYDNARLPQALIVTGRATSDAAYCAAGLRSLRWLMTMQTAPSGVFRPIGTDGFGMRRQAPLPFDQQPLEATATIGACLAADQVEGGPDWKRAAERAFAWFLGENDLGLPLVDVATGSCRDGLHADRANDNRGGESVLSYLLGLTEIRALARSSRGYHAPRPLSLAGRA
jgi:glycosyltransferase involved in cell wall biosynthesis